MTDQGMEFIEKAIDLKPGEELQSFIGDIVKAVRKLSIDQEDGPVMLHGIFADHVVLRSFGMGRGNGSFLKVSFERSKDGVKLGTPSVVRMTFTPVKKNVSDAEDNAEDLVFDLLT